MRQLAAETVLAALVLLTIIGGPFQTSTLAQAVPHPTSFTAPPAPTPRLPAPEPTTTTTAACPPLPTTTTTEAPPDTEPEGE